jgi:hypothetical protein
MHNMTHVKHFLELVEYKITSADAYYLGAHTLWSYEYAPEPEKYSIHCVFHPDTREIEILEFCDYWNNRAWRWSGLLEPGQVFDEVEAWEGTVFLPCVSALDWCAQVEAYWGHAPMETIEADIDADTWAQLARLAHDQDLTINETIARALWAQIREHQLD